MNRISKLTSSSLVQPSSRPGPDFSRKSGLQLLCKSKPDPGKSQPRDQPVGRPKDQGRCQTREQSRVSVQPLIRRGDPGAHFFQQFQKQIIEFILSKKNDRLQSVKQPQVNEEMRQVVVNWLVAVHLRTRMREQVLYLAVWIMDQYLSLKTVTTLQLQLLAVSSLFLSSKFEEIYPPSLEYFAALAEQAYSQDEIAELEGAILQTLEFDLSYDSPLRLLEIFGMQLEINKQQYHSALYLTQLGLLSSEVVAFPPAVQALSSLFLNKVIEKQPQVARQTVLALLPQFEQSVKKCAKLVCLLLEQAPKSKNQAARSKFSSARFGGAGRLAIVARDGGECFSGRRV